MKNMITIVTIIGFAALFVLSIGLEVSFNPFKVQIKRLWEGLFWISLLICFIGYQYQRDKRILNEEFERASEKIVKIYSKESVKEVGVESTVKILERVSKTLKKELEEDNDKD